MDREQAIDQQGSIIVKAPAGSGKTELLVQRYLSLLGESCQDPAQIVAITFTRKAAAEMRNRIRQELQRKEPPEEEHKQITYKLSRKVLEKAQEKNWHTPSLITEENVTTIDSFCHTLLAVNPLEGKFLSMPEILTELELDGLYLEAAQLAIDTMKEGKQNKKDRELVMHLLYTNNNSPGELKDKIKNTLAHRNSILPLITEIQKKQYKPDEVIKKLVKCLLAELQRDLPLDLLRSLTENMQEVENQFPSEMQLREDLDWENARLEDWQALANLILTRGGSVRKQFKEDDGFARDLPAVNEIISIVGKLRKDFSWWTPQLVPLRAWDWIYSEEESKSVEASQRIIFLAASFLIQVFRQHNRCDHTEVMLAAIEVMGAEDAPTLLAERLGNRLRHLLIDEFQDTSIGQLQLLEKITSSWDETTDTSLFLVGDPMQSIYAFRQADVRVFNQLWNDQRLGQLPLAQLTLEDNYRSNAPIVEWLNNNFPIIFDYAEDMLTAGVSYTKAQATKDAPADALAKEPQHLGVIHKRRQRITPDQLYAPILQKIKEIQKKKPDASIGILTRARKDINGLLPLLHREHIEFDASKFISSQDNPIIEDLLSLTRAIYNTRDEVAWYACLRAPWCGLLLTDLWAISQGKAEEGLSLWEFLTRLAAKPADAKKWKISADGMKRIQLFSKAMQVPMEHRMRSHWHTLIDKAWNLLQGPSLLNEYKDKVEVELFMDTLQNIAKGGRFDINKLTRYVARTHASFESKAPVKILTIHHAKGLEFDYVFLASLHRQGSTAGQSDNLLNFCNFKMAKMAKTAKTAHNSADLTAISVNPFTEAGKQHSVNNMIKYVNREQEDQEKRRLFYVATSRAREGLFLHYALYPKKSPDFPWTIYSRSLLNLLDRIDVGKSARNFIDFTATTASSEENGEVIASDTDDDELIMEQGERKIRRIHSDELDKLIAAVSVYDSADTDEPGGIIDGSDRTDGLDGLGGLDGSPRRQLFHWSNPFARCQGTAIHLLMQNLAEKSGDELLALSKDAGGQNNVGKEIAGGLELLMRENAMDKKQIAEINKSVEEALRFCLKDKRGLWILTPSGMNERAFVAKESGMSRVDRTFIDGEGTKDAVRWIVDYKTGKKGKFSKEEIHSFHKQLSGYGKIIKAMQEQENTELPIKLGVYCPQSGFWQEWDYA